MAEILVRARPGSNPDPVKDRLASKLGYPVVVMPDGHEWGDRERLPRFVVVKIPGISVEKVKKYIQPEYTNEVGPDNEPMKNMYRRRLWRIRWADLPQAAKDKLTSNGELTIKAGTYTGPRDYTWPQIKQYFRNQQTGLDETENL